MLQPSDEKAVKIPQAHAGELGARVREVSSKHGDSFEFGHGPRQYPLPWGHRGTVELCAQTSLNDAFRSESGGVSVYIGSSSMRRARTGSHEDFAKS